MKKLILFIFGFSVVFSCTDSTLEDIGFSVKNQAAYVSFANSGGTVTPINLTAKETDPTQNLRIEAASPITDNVIVNYSFSGSAVFGTDFSVVSTTGGSVSNTGGTIIIVNDQRKVGVTDYNFINLGITPLTDAASDGTKTLIVTIESATVGGKAITVGRGDGGLLKSATINFTNVALSVAFASASISTIENAKSKSALRVVPNFKVPANASVTVNYSLTGTATLDTDFKTKAALTNSLVIPAGSTGALLDSIYNIDDNLKEVPEKATFTITSVSIAGSGNSVIIGTNAKVDYNIADENKTIVTAPEATPLKLNSLNDIGNKNFKVTLPNISNTNLVVSYTITGGVAGIDYIDSSGGSITFLPGQTSSNIVLMFPQTAFKGKGNKTPIQLSIDLTSITTTDAEVSLTSTSTLKQFKVEITPID